MTGNNRRRWWQNLCPRYGNWGGPGWSAGCWNDDPTLTDWTVEPMDEMDAAFKDHDRAYQTGGSRLFADLELVQRLRAIIPTGVRGRLYRRGAIAVFSLRIRWMFFQERNISRRRA